MSQPTHAGPDLPLSGIRMFEFGSNVAGPYAGWIMAQLGAEVIKIERPEGDDARSWGPPFWNGSSTIFHAINFNKQSLCVDLKDPVAAAALRRRIVDEADVVLQNQRPGALVKLGFSAEELTAANPRLIYCNLHAFGAEGPLKDRPGYDTLMQAFGGIMSVTGEEDRPPVRAAVSVADSGSGMWCVIGILSALHRRTLTGRGGIIDASLFETVLGWMSLHITGYQANGEVPIRRGTAARGIVPYEGYRCSDGWLIIAASNDRLFARLAEALGHAEWAQDERFRTNPQRVEYREELRAMLEGVLMTAPRAVWQATFEAAGVPSSPLQSVDEVLVHPQTQAVGMLQATGVTGMKLLGLPFSLDGERPPLQTLAPELGKTGKTVDAY
jgi:crotonobetainyl-CoA:carnitine CoA-transferase CaiB-like acyl-CoA transferase